MIYELSYYEMDLCSNINPVEGGEKVVRVGATDDDAAIRDANYLLKNMGQHSRIIPWGPALYLNGRKVAASDPSYPPRAHRLTWRCVSQELIPQ